MRGGIHTMLSSKELMEKAGVSRATLNNYIGMGLIPKPVIKNPDSAEDKARRLGYFPENALERLHEIDGMKKRGMRMASIIDALTPAKNSNQVKIPAHTASTQPDLSRGISAQEGGLQLTIDKLEHPAYLVNNRFEIEWSNVDSETQILGQYSGLSTDIEDRNLFHLLFGGDSIINAESRDEILSFHLSIAKNRISKAALLTANPQLDRKSVV